MATGGELPSLPKCDKHPNNVIGKYCKDHDEVGCIDCMAENHSGQCQELHDITDFVNDNKNIVPECILEGESTETELKSRKNVFHQELTGLQQNKKHVIENLENTRDKLIDIIRNVERGYDEIHKDLECKITDLKNEIGKIEKMLKDVTSVSKNPPEAFVLSIKGKDVVSKAKQLNKDMERVTLAKRVAFDLDSLYKTIQKDIGNVWITITRRLYRFRLMDTNIRCGTQDSCCTPDGSVFFTGSSKHSISRISYQTLKVVKKHPLSSTLSGVCCVSNSTIAVSLGKTIQMINIAGELTLTTDSKKVYHKICGLDYHDDIFYVTSGNTVYKYDKNGKQLISYSVYPDRNNIFSDIKNLVVNPLNKHIHVADYDNGVITMNQEGHVLNVVKDNISRPWGICVDQYGQVFVSGHESDNIIQLSCDGRYITTVISKGLINPRGICFDTTREIFYVGYGNGHVKVYRVVNATE